MPASAAAALEAAVRDALPDLVDAAPNLLYQLVTMVSPAELIRRGVPVRRLVHRAGSFAITFPNAYHAGFNTGFNCAEAVNFGPPDWLPSGSAAAEHYRARGKPATISHDALVISCCRAARVSEDARRSGRARRPRSERGKRPKRTWRRGWSRQRPRSRGSGWPPSSGASSSSSPP